MSDDIASRKPVSKSSPDDRPDRRPPSTSRNLPPLTSTDLSRARRDAPPRPPSVQGVAMRPTPPPSSTPPEQRAARPIGVENLLNPSASGNSGASSQRQHAERTDSPRTVSTVAVFHPVSPSILSTSTRKSSTGEISLPSITPPLINAYPLPPRATTPRSPTTYGPGPITSGLPTGNIDARQSPFVLPRDQVTAAMGPGPLSATPGGTTPSGLPSSYVSSLAPAHVPSGIRQQNQIGQIPRSHNPSNAQGGVGVAPFFASRSSSPSPTPHRHSPPASAAEAGQPQPFFSAPFPTSGPTSTIPQGAFDRKSAAGPSAPGQGHYPMMTFETESGPIQVPVDVQAASRVADEKRKRNATASHRFRQRRKEKEQETANNISSLEARVREITDEKDFYQRERDFLQDVIVRNRISLPPRPASPRRRRHTSLGGPHAPQYQDPEAGSREEGRNTRRRTSAYVAPHGPPQHAMEHPPQMPPFDRMSALPTENLQTAQQRVRPQGTFQPGPHLFGPNPPH